VVTGYSVNLKFSHWKWFQTERKDRGIKEVKFPMVSDQSKSISENYRVLAGDWKYDDQGVVIFNGAP
jgi:peroxiredoxin (alkyl hydroperoxide reductase subunit C)